MTSQEQVLFASMKADSVGMIVAICVLAPVLEEMLFRGIILRSFAPISGMGCYLGVGRGCSDAHMNICSVLHVPPAQYGS